MQVQRLCAQRGLPLVCVQPLVSHIAREQQDYTAHKTDESDCVMIARLAVELHLGGPAFSGQLNLRYFMLRAAGSGIR